jgi:hypothetical protein
LNRVDYWTDTDEELGAGELLTYNLEVEASQQGLGKSNMLPSAPTLDLATKFRRLGGLIFRLFRGGFGTLFRPTPSTNPVEQPIDLFLNGPAYTTFSHVGIMARPVAPLASSFVQQVQGDNCARKSPPRRATPVTYFIQTIPPTLRSRLLHRSHPNDLLSRAEDSASP